MNDEPIIRFFAYDHLPEGDLREMSRHFCELADHVVFTAPASEERTAALRKLLEGKDAAVRAML